MNEKMRLKLKNFWWKYGGTIILLGTLVGITGLTAYGAKKAIEADQQREEEARAKAKAESEKWLAEYEAQQKAIAEDPANQIPGGGYVQENGMDEDSPYLIANDVPADSMGEFGEELKKRLAESWGNSAEEVPFTVDHPKISIMAYVEYDKNMEEDSQEKQPA